MYTKAPRRNSKAYPAWVAAQEAERLRPKSNTNWSTPKTNYFAGINCLRKALASGYNAKLERRWNEECEFPIKINPNAPYPEQVVKKFKHKVWIVVLYFNHPTYKAPFLTKVFNAILYPLKYVPRKSVLQMKEYRKVTYRVGDVINGFSIEIQIPKKFGFK